MSTKKSAATDAAEPSSYAEAEAELEQILEALESEQVDVDELSAHVARARELITWCRATVARAEVTITELLDEG
ncbi:exodeoxyribonuclease VII small subunit [Euzebya tangerina]|uniref:exodeoxyribonuclease VII small subunit n=1 Tax=Euzebya tangerina TaxID=591198 RepID=UPI000E318AE0|nr:exodeoxyribonuclease VII small subunit [Euzebya tangerina]